MLLKIVYCYSIASPPYQCSLPGCLQCFGNKPNRERHAKKTLHEEPTIECSLCGLYVHSSFPVVDRQLTDWVSSMVRTADDFNLHCERDHFDWSNETLSPRLLKMLQEALGLAPSTLTPVTNAYEWLPLVGRHLPLPPPDNVDEEKTNMNLVESEPLTPTPSLSSATSLAPSPIIETPEGSQASISPVEGPMDPPLLPYEAPPSLIFQQSDTSLGLLGLTSFQDDKDLFNPNDYSSPFDEFLNFDTFIPSYP